MENLAIGIDLQVNYMEISYFDEEKQESVEVKESSGGKMTQYPLDLFYSSKENVWIAGLEASEHYMSEAGEFYTDLLSHIGDRTVAVAGGQEYDGTDLFCVMVCTQLQQSFGKELAKLRKVVITSPFAGLELQKAVKRLAKYLHLKREQIELVSPTMATLFYIFSQETNIWDFGVGIFEYTEKGLTLKRIGVNRYQRPMRISVTDEVFDTMPPMSAEAEEKDIAFSQICKNAFRGRSKNVSGVYLLGEGFEQDWLDRAAGNLCQSRRVFMGQNMCVNGACLAAQSGSAAINSDGNIYVEAPGIIHYDIGVKVLYQGREQIAPIALGEQEWFALTGSACIFLDDTNRIEIDMYHRGTNEMVKEIIEIKGLPKRPPKTTKLKISVRYLDAKRGEICIEDKGFGALYPTTGKMYVKEFQLP